MDYFLYNPASKQNLLVARVVSILHSHLPLIMVQEFLRIHTLTCTCTCAPEGVLQVLVS